MRVASLAAYTTQGGDHPAGMLRTIVLLGQSGDHLPVPTY
jgi:hypothetical protein